MKKLINACTEVLICVALVCLIFMLTCTVLVLLFGLLASALPMLAVAGLVVGCVWIFSPDFRQFHREYRETLQSISSNVAA